MKEDLKNQYFNLTEEQKNVLLLYKSRLGLLMNDLDNNPNYEEYYNYYVNLFNNPLNIMIKMTVFKNIDLTNLDSFIKTVNEAKELLDNTINKMVLTEDTTVYRVISSNKDITTISKSNIISTSRSFVESLKFANAGDNITLYQINLKKGSHIGFVPYNILNDTKNHRLVISSVDNQDEIILDKNIYDFTEVNKKNMNTMYMIEVNATEKDIVKER